MDGRVHIASKERKAISRMLYCGVSNVVFGKKTVLCISSSSSFSSLSDDDAQSPERLPVPRSQKVHSTGLAHTRAR